MKLSTRRFFLKNKIRKILIVLIVFNLFVASWHELNEDINFPIDIERDFLILKEIGEENRADRSEIWDRAFISWTLEILG